MLLVAVEIVAPTVTGILGARLLRTVTGTAGSPGSGNPKYPTVACSREWRP